MTFRSLTDAELDLGIDKAFKKYGCTIHRRNFRIISEKMVSVRYEGKTFQEAFRSTLDHLKLKGDRREWYKTALGAAFNSRKKPMHRGRVPKHRATVILREGQTVDGNGQYSFALSP